MPSIHITKFTSQLDLLIIASSPLPALYLPLKILLFLKHIILIQFSCDGCFIIFIFDRVNTADPVHFTLTPPECHMEIRNGYGTSGTRVTGPVHVGDPLTLLILMRSQWGMYYSFIHNTYRYIDPSCHNFKNCFLS